MSLLCLVESKTGVFVALVALGVAVWWEPDQVARLAWPPVDLLALWRERAMGG